MRYTSRSDAGSPDARIVSCQVQIVSCPIFSIHHGWTPSLFCLDHPSLPPSAFEMGRRAGESAQVEGFLRNRAKPSGCALLHPPEPPALRRRPSGTPPEPRARLGEGPSKRGASGGGDLCNEARRGKRPSERSAARAWAFWDEAALVPLSLLVEDAADDAHRFGIAVDVQLAVHVRHVGADGVDRHRLRLHDIGDRSALHQVA